MKKFLTLALVALMATTAMAQNEQDERGERRGRKEMSERFVKALAKQLKLDDATTNWFTPLFQEYQDTLQAVRRGNRADEKRVKKMSDAEVKDLIQTSFDKEEKVVALKRAYYAKFAEKLTAQQLYQVFNPQMNRQNLGNNNRQQGGGFRGGFPGGGPGGFGGPGF